MEQTSLSELMAEAARELQAQSDAVQTMQTAVEVAVRELEGADAAALSMITSGRRVETLAATSEQARRGDELQYELGQGPCLHAVWEEHLVHVPDLTAEQRWPRWADRATQETGYRSLMAFHLFTTADAVGALNLYSSQPRGFDIADRDHGLALAAHISVAVRDAQQIEQLQTALAGRTVISQATGMLMERHGLRSETAFAVLVRVSSATNIKLRDIAAELCRTGDLPDASRSSSTPGSHRHDPSVRRGERAVDSARGGRRT